MTVMTVSVLPLLFSRTLTSVLSILETPFPSWKKMSRASRIVDFPTSFFPTKTVKLSNGISVVFLYPLKFLMDILFIFIVLTPFQFPSRNGNRIVNGLIATDINISKLVKRIKQKKQKIAEKNWKDLTNERLFLFISWQKIFPGFDCPRKRYKGSSAN